MSNYPPDNKHDAQPSSGESSQLSPEPPIYSRTLERGRSINGQSGVITYSVLYRDTNTMLRVDLPKGNLINSKGGSMVAMSPSIRLEGKFKRGFMLFASGDVMYTTMAAADADGYIFLAPPILGDVYPIHLEGRPVIFGKHSYLAHTDGIQLSVKSQGIFKGFFSGEGLFTIKAEGEGVLFLYSLGAIHTIDLPSGEEIIIDNGHLVAWDETMDYKIEKASGFIASLTTGEGFVCRFKGPGRVYMQTRKPDDFTRWVKGYISYS